MRTMRARSGVGEGTYWMTLAFLIGGGGLWLLHTLVNPLTMWLTLATFLGYAVIYTVLLKPATPMNIVIGGAAGAMPPLLGWTAITGSVAPEALVLFLIIFRVSSYENIRHAFYSIHRCTNFMTHIGEEQMLGFFTGFGFLFFGFDDLVFVL